MNLPLFRRASAAALSAAATLLFLAGDASALTFNTIHTFDAPTEGNVTYPPLVQGADGRLYGVNSTGGRSDNGTVFSLTVGGGSFQTLNTFTQTNQGTTPKGGLVQARDGNFYGTTNTGGTGGYGTFFQCVPDTGKLGILAQFTNGNPGANPTGTPVEAIDGGILGTARYGGTTNYGTVYRFDPVAGSVVTFAQITGGLAGFYPQSDLVQATDGNFYGTTEQGGTYSNGTFFRVTPDGVYTVLYSFTGSQDGGRPIRGVVQGTDGLFYGVCNTGGQYGGGAIYRIAAINATFQLTVLHGFIPQALDGSNALGGLVQASDGNFYGTTAAGGTNGNGTVYRTTATGGYDVLYSFTNGVDGAAPVAGLTQASDGKLYGTTAGTNGQLGTVFRVDIGAAAPLPRPLYLLQASVATGGTILIKGDNFVGTTGVLFSASGGTVPASSFAVLSRTVLQATVPEGAVSGPVAVVNAGGTGTTPTALTVNVVAPPVVTAKVSVVADPALASKVDGTKAKIKISRADGDTSLPLTVSYKIRANSTAVLGTDYKLSTSGAPLGTSGTVTIPAGQTAVKLKVKPLGTTDGPTTKLVLKLGNGDGYQLAAPKKATVQILGNTAGQ